MQQSDEPTHGTHGTTPDNLHPSQIKHPVKHNIHNWKSYTITKEAHAGLCTLFKPNGPSKSTVYRRMQSPQYDGFTVVLQSQVRDLERPSTEGVSHALNTICQHYDITEWVDTRPSYIKSQHAKLQQVPVYKTVKEAQEANTRESRQTGGKAKWYIPLIPQDIKDMEDDDTPWDELTLREQQERLHIMSRQPQEITLSLTDYTREYLEHLAHRHKMDTLTDYRSQTVYIAAVLVAIGIRWLQPPEDYVELITSYINKNKSHPLPEGAPRRKRTRRAKGEGTYGNHEHTPWVYKPYTHYLLAPEDHIDHPDHVFTLQDVTYFNYMIDKYAPPTSYLLPSSGIVGSNQQSVGNNQQSEYDELDIKTYNYYLEALQRATTQLVANGLLPATTTIYDGATPLQSHCATSGEVPKPDATAPDATPTYIKEGPNFVPSKPPANPDVSPARQSYYASLRRLTDEQIQEAYTAYYVTPKRTNTNPPSQAKLARRYGVSQNTMFRALFSYKLKLEQTQQEAQVQ